VPGLKISILVLAGNTDDPTVSLSLLSVTGHFLNPPGFGLSCFLTDGRASSLAHAFTIGMSTVSPRSSRACSPRHSEVTRPA
jgi:hypothetical protein